jgi:soluble lytic murein transglycosylase
MQEKGVFVRKPYSLIAALTGALFCLMIVLAGQIAYASTDNDVVSALKQAEKGNWGRLQQLANRSGDPAVQSALKWYAYTQGVSDNSFASTARFLQDHKDWPYIDKIRLEAEKHINDNVPDVVVIEWFKNNRPFTSYGMDRYLNALKARARYAEIKDLLQEWWSDADLTRDQQKQFFASYGRFITRESHMKRMNALLYRRDYANAFGVAEVLGNGYVQLAKARKALATDDPAVNAYIAGVPANLKNDEGLLYGRLKWRRENDLNDGAIEILNHSPSAKDMYDPKLWWRERHIIIRRLLEKKDYQRAYRLAASHKQEEGFPLAQAEWIAGWLALRFVQKPWQSFEHFERLYKNVKTPISKARGAYWAGRASDALRHPEISKQWYSVAIRYPETFYGQLAAENLGQKINIAQKIPTISPAQRQGFRRQPLVKATKWFAKAGMKQETTALLLRLSKNAKTTEEFLYAAELADVLGYRHVAIKISQDLQAEKNVRVAKYLYPSLTDELRDVRNVEWALVNALIRQESRFDEQAISSAGARGLMQLMPATAKHVASKKGLRHQTDWLVTRPPHNILLGSDYIYNLIQKFDGNYAMAAAAYNAGPNRVVQWNEEVGDPRKGEIDLIDWIELIPFYETRNYVQRVLEGVYVYRDVIQENQKMPMAEIHVAEK